MTPNRKKCTLGKWPIEHGSLVYSTDGGKVGTVRNFHAHRDYLDVQKGWLFTKDFFVPLSSVKAVTGEGIILRLTKEQLEATHYDAPPVTTEEEERVKGFALTEGTMWDEAEVPAESGVVSVAPTH